MKSIILSIAMCAAMLVARAETLSYTLIQNSGNPVITAGTLYDYRAKAEGPDDYGFSLYLQPVARTWTDYVE